MKEFSHRRWMALLKKLAYYEVIREIGGCLTPVEIMHCLQMGMQIWSDNEQEILLRIGEGDCRPKWVYFKAGTLDPDVLIHLTVGGRLRG